LIDPIIKLKTKKDQIIIEMRLSDLLLQYMIAADIRVIDFWKIDGIYLNDDKIDFDYTLDE
jgi:hypothetical protein